MTRQWLSSSRANWSACLNFERHELRGFQSAGHKVALWGSPFQPPLQRCLTLLRISHSTPSCMAHADAGDDCVNSKRVQRNLQVTHAIGFRRRQGTGADVELDRRQDQQGHLQRGVALGALLPAGVSNAMMRVFLGGWSWPLEAESYDRMADESIYGVCAWCVAVSLSGTQKIVVERAACTATVS